MNKKMNKNIKIDFDLKSQEIKSSVLLSELTDNIVSSYKMDTEVGKDIFDTIFNLTDHYSKLIYTDVKTLITNEAITYSIFQDSVTLTIYNKMVDKELYTKDNYIESLSLSNRKFNMDEFEKISNIIDTVINNAIKINK